MDKHLENMTRIELLDFLGYQLHQYIILTNGNVELYGQEITLEELINLATEKNEDLK